MQPRRPGLLGGVLDAWQRSALNCTQHAQRRLLRLGQAPDPCDIEALVGSVASQRAEGLATLQVPERDGPVIPATSQPASIRTHLHTINFVLPELHPVPELPPAPN